MTTWTLDGTLPTLDSNNPGDTLDGLYSGAAGKTSVFTWVPSYTSSLESEVRLREARFGDGYMLRRGVGINSIGDKWSLVFNNRLEKEKEEIKAFFRARPNGLAFEWTPYDEGTPVKVYCKKWNITAVGANVYSIACTFERVYGE